MRVRLFEDARGGASPRGEQEGARRDTRPWERRGGGGAGFHGVRPAWGSLALEAGKQQEEEERKPDQDIRGLTLPLTAACGTRQGGEGDPWPLGGSDGAELWDRWRGAGLRHSRKGQPDDP